jgi:FkbM family methyltransferase
LIVDVGAHTGYNTVYAAVAVGRGGRVIALEPTADARAVLRENLSRNHLTNVTVLTSAAGNAPGERDFFIRGGTSAVNSLFADSFYAEVTDVARVKVDRLDDLIEGVPQLVKIDVEGAELEVLDGMTRLLDSPGMRLIVEWHPALQAAAGYAPDALPRFLLDQGFTLRAAGHLGTRTLTSREVPALTRRLLTARRPVEIAAARHPGTGTRRGRS